MLAPHGVEHTRAGRVKPAEVQTSDLARDLHRSLHCPVIIKTKSNDDASELRRAFSLS